VNRSTRRFVVADIGHEVYRHATAMLTQADAALEAGADGTTAERIDDVVGRHTDVRGCPLDPLQYGKTRTCHPPDA
jgi:hypothetical protein